MTTDTIGSPSPDAVPVEIPGWCDSRDSTPPIHRHGGDV